MRRVTTLGIIGAGRIGRLHAENIITNPNIKLKSISDIFLDSMKDWAEELGIEQIVADYKDIIEDEEIDAVFVCSPTSTHAGIIKEAASKGKHIFCEKPISFSTEETKEVLEAVESAGVKFQVGFNRRFDRNFSRIHSIVKEGGIGSPQMIKITSRDPAPPPAEYILKSGGLFFDMAIHDFDMARYLACSEVVEVFATGANLVEPYIKEAGDIDTAIITLKFENGALGVIDNSRKAVYGYDQRVEVFGSEGNLTCDNDRNSSVELSTENGSLKDPLKHFFLERYEEAYHKETIAFIDSIQNDLPLVCSGFDGLQAEIIAKASKTSYEQGRPVKIGTIDL
ncbi:MULTISPECIES: inositol 2-dehydrogenase [unclassified Sporosarcina]|uniref:inositol 2-dehydrogenase n=1 Tax=unclassified Sporosarcina TaxID=2647733 RepID=UPI002041AD3D|nr:MULTISPECIES: inositol 2-dehydrogenase [unclassified Sporosarcina]GKV65852.1 inositol 2-dehydrogenase [Sporosarcina sp. NCCP-2331]GLB55977.1 inositol 2-dehydrogenase [Sporosarcina sp. NCCP-2378]